MPMQMSKMLLPYALEKASLYFLCFASFMDNIVSGILEATAAIKKVTKNKFIFRSSDKCSLLLTSCLQEIEMMIREINKMIMAFTFVMGLLPKMRFATSKCIIFWLNEVFLGSSSNFSITLIFEVNFDRL